MKTRRRVVQVECRKMRNGDCVALIMVSCVWDEDDDIDSNELENEKW